MAKYFPRYIPSRESKKWTTCDLNDYIGAIWKSFNINLYRKPGKVLLNDRLAIVNDDSDTNMSNLTRLNRFIRSNADTTDRWWGVNETGRMFKTTGASSLNDTWAQDALSNTPTDATDAAIHETANGEDRLVVTRNTDIAILNRVGAANTWTASWWQGTLGQAALNGSVHHPLGVFNRLLIIGDKNLVHTVDRNDVVSASRLTFDPNVVCQVILVGRDRIWFLCANSRSDNGLIYEWDGYSSSYNNVYPALSVTPLSGVLYEEIPFILNDRGHLLKFNGNGFHIQKYLMPEEESLYSTNGTTVSCNYNGMMVKNGIIYMNIRVPALSTGSYSKRATSGIWLYEPETDNLYHGFSLTQYKTGTDKDFGQQNVVSVGALKEVGLGGRFLVSGRIYDQDTTGAVISGIWIASDEMDSSGNNYANNRGYFITGYIPAQEIEETWETVWIKFRKLLSSNNKIVVKARTDDGRINVGHATLVDGTMKASKISWTSTTTFTSVVPTGVIVGDEVEIMNGDGAGCCVHIQSMSGTPNGSSTITVTIDEAVPVASGDANVRYENWVKIMTITSQTIFSQSASIADALGVTALDGSFVQFKVEMRGVLVEVEQLVVNGETNVEAKV